VERIINEPTAAALDYGIDHMDSCKNILIYDLGGGTLDVTLLEMYEGVLDVKASNGNNQLGGKDFDQCLMDFLLERFLRENNLDVIDDPRSLMRLKEASEMCKIALSVDNEYKIGLPFFAEVCGNPIALEQLVTREQFEELIKDMIDSTQKQISTVLTDSNSSIQDIDLILLVGGSTRIPYVRKFVENVMGKAPQCLVDSDLAVVRGASIQAGIMNDELSSEQDIMITDVCPYTMGTSILSYVGGFPVADVYDVIIPRNVTIPVAREKIYGTSQDNQTEVIIESYQGENKKASHNNLLGKFHLNGIPLAPAFKEKIKVLFSYDVNGILQVAATILSTGKMATITIETTGVKMVEEVDLSGWKDALHAKSVRAIIKKAEKIIENGEAGVYEIEIEGLIMKIKETLIVNKDELLLAQLKEELTDLIYDLMEEEDDGFSG
jgi:molecular chaperone DnaK